MISTTWGRGVWTDRVMVIINIYIIASFAIKQDRQWRQSKDETRKPKAVYDISHHGGRRVPTAAYRLIMRRELEQEIRDPKRDAAWPAVWV
jgi:hypothetical protein